MAAEAGRWSRVKDLLADALERAAPDRARFLDGACAGDAGLRAEVERLLAAHDGAGGFLETPAAIPAGAVPEPGSPGFVGGARIGRYRIRRQIGAGGMGVVYEGEQEEPHRTVALKVLRPGIASGPALRRFRREAELLGRLRHPAIAAIYEAGTHGDPSAPDGDEAVPFFAMELVEGRPLVEHADAKGLGTRERVGLFVRICDAVEYAHRAGVLHRDLKPGNILVEESGQPKILDFGVARSTDSDLRATTLRTEVGEIVGTLPYMSPEQLAGDPDLLDERSDVYALGVVLYELLAGRLPHDLANRSLPEVARILGEEDPTPLSAVNRRFRGDLDTIVGKALEKEKHRRYASAADLAGDLAHYLEDRPITARPASAIYRLRKFADRNRMLVAGVCAVFLALVLGLAGTVRGMRRAEEEARRAREVAEFFRRMITASDPALMVWGTADGAWGSPRAPRGRDTKIADVLDETVRGLDEGSGGSPEVEGTLRLALGQAYAGLGRWKDAEAQLRSGVAIRRRVFGESHVETARAMTRLGFALDLQDRNSGEAEDLLRRAVEIHRRASGRDDRETLRASLLQGWGMKLRSPPNKNLKRAEAILRETLESQRRLFGAQDSDTLSTMTCLTNVLVARGFLREAESLGREAVEGIRTRFGRDHPMVAVATFFVAQSVQRQGRIPEAEVLHREAFEGYRRNFGEDHPYTHVVGEFLAETTAAAGRLDEAEPLLRRSFEELRRQLGRAHPETEGAASKLRRLLWLRGETGEAVRLSREDLGELRSSVGNQHRWTLDAMNELAWRIKDIGKCEEAEALAREATAGCRNTLGEEDRQTLNTIDTLGVVLRMEGKVEEAESLLRCAVATSRRTSGEGDAGTAAFRCHLGECLADLRCFDEAEAELLAAHAALVAAQGPRHETTRAAIVALVRLYDEWEKPDKAAGWRARRENPDLPASRPDPTSGGGR
ncbi:MAG TPA: serine/threonine-protein kinase [Planctomycetota bacterium]|jgi:hypothetical protein|nr:serine/threonine-protein kinase [Planctomycetota bacterium]